MDLKTYWRKRQRQIDRALDRFLPKASTAPATLHRAMRYSVFAGGKRLRPLLTIAAAESCGGRAAQVLPIACAMELIHTYSLVHDDLPAMDNDDLRRGKPTNHKVFGEDMAILTGDALLTHAFGLVHRNARLKNVPIQSIPVVIEVIAKGAGSLGMVGGQVADVQSDKGRWKRCAQIARLGFRNERTLLEFIHTNKTAALINASLEAGGRLAGGSQAQCHALKKFGEHLGLAFQITDDILDRIGDKKKLGKKGSDKSNDKLTYVSLYGLDKSRIEAKKQIEMALNCLRIFGRKGDVLRSIAQFVLQRDR